MQPVSRDIDGFTFTISPLPAMRALALAPRVAELFAGPLEKLKLSDGGDSIGPALAAVMRTDPTKLVSLTRELLEGAIVRTPEGIEGPLMPRVDVLFAGKTMTLLKAAAFSVEVNCGDFFAEARKRLGALGANAKAAAFKSRLETMLSGSGPSSGSSEPGGSPGLS